jgi:hypothetical protein
MQIHVESEINKYMNKEIRKKDRDGNTSQARQIEQKAGA